MALLRTLLFSYPYIAMIIATVSALKIHMSENAHEALEAFPEFITETRGEIAVKVAFSSWHNYSRSTSEVASKHSDDKDTWTWYTAASTSPCFFMN